MRIVYTKHIKKKLRSLKISGINIDLTTIGEIIRNPIHIDKTSDYPKIIVSGKLDDKHILRVVYKKDGGIIKIITCYPAKKGRYFTYENEN